VTCVDLTRNDSEKEVVHHVTDGSINAKHSLWSRNSLTTLIDLHDDDGGGGGGGNIS
jgi:hypothetical protein